MAWEVAAVSFPAPTGYSWLFHAGLQKCPQLTDCWAAGFQHIVFFLAQTWEDEPNCLDVRDPGPKKTSSRCSCVRSWGACEALWVCQSFLEKLALDGFGRKLPKRRRHFMPRFCKFQIISIDQYTLRVCPSLLDQVPSCNCAPCSHWYMAIPQTHIYIYNYTVSERWLGNCLGLPSGKLT